MLKKTIFFLLIFLSIFSFLITYFSKNNFKNTLFYPTIYQENIIIEASKPIKDNIFLEINSKLYNFVEFKNTNFKHVNLKVNSLSFYVDENFNSISKIVIINGFKLYSFKNFSKFEKAENKEICMDKCKTYQNYKVDFDIINNQNNFLNISSSLINTFFSFDKTFLISYIFLFLAIFCLIKNELNFKLFSQNKILALLLVLFCFLRIGNINELPIWGDEAYSILISRSNFLNIFNDPGNPPFYYFVLHLYFKFFNSIVFLKYLSILFIFLTLIFLYNFAKDKFNLKVANISLFLITISIPLIYYSSHIRCYGLQIFLSLLLTIYLFKIIEKSNDKYFICYLILSILASNTHYFSIILILFNFIFGIIYLRKENDKLIKFISLHFLVLIFFLPYFLKTALSEALLNEKFNYSELNFENIINIILFIFGGCLSMIFSIYFYIKNRKEMIFNYLFLVIVFVLAFAILLSVFIRPMLEQRYFIFLIPYISLFLAIIFSSKYKNKYVYLLFFIWFILIQNNSNIYNFKKQKALDYNLIELAKNENEAYIISGPSMKAVSELNLNKSINYIFIDEIKNREKREEILEKNIDEILSKDKNAKIYTSLLEFNKENLDKNTCYFNFNQDVCLWKIAKRL